MTSIRKRRRQIARLAKGPALCPVFDQEYQAAQAALNRQFRNLMDNMALANNPNIELRAYGERRTA